MWRDGGGCFPHLGYVTRPAGRVILLILVSPGLQQALTHAHTRLSTQTTFFCEQTTKVQNENVRERPIVC